MKMWTCTPPPAGRAAAGQRGVGCKSTFSYFFRIFFIFLGKGQFIRFPYQLQLTKNEHVRPGDKSCELEHSRDLLRAYTGKYAFPMLFEVFSHILISGAFIWALPSRSHTRKTRRIDPHGPETLKSSKVQKSRVCNFQIVGGLQWASLGTFQLPRYTVGS